MTTAPTDIIRKGAVEIITEEELTNKLKQKKPSEALQMLFQAEGYQKGPIHVGQVEVFLRSYVWTEKQLKGYQKYREAEDLELLKTIDATISETMDALGDAPYSIASFHFLVFVTMSTALFLMSLAIGTCLVRF